MTVAPLERYRPTLVDSVVFAGLSVTELDAIIAASELIDVSPGQTLLAEGRKGEGLYVILEGEIEFFLPERSVGGVRRPSRVRLNVLGRGRCFGEYGVIDDKPSSASAQALTAARLCLLSTDALRRIVEENDRIGKIVYANLLGFLWGRLGAKGRGPDLGLFVEGPTADR